MERDHASARQRCSRASRPRHWRERRSAPKMPCVPMTEDAMDVFEAINTRTSMSVLRDPGPTDRQWEIFCARARGLQIMVDCGLGGFSSCAAKRARCSAASWPRPCARANRIRPRKRSTANDANLRGRQRCLSWPSSPSRIPACPKSSDSGGRRRGAEYSSRRPRPWPWRDLAHGRAGL